MQLVIEIDNKYYNDIKNSSTAHPYSVLYALDSIRNGTPLPKGHGRLIDADELYIGMNRGFDRFLWSGSDLMDYVKDAPTIIVAERTEE